MKGVIESFDFLKGVPMAKYFIVNSEADLSKVGFPCYLKADVEGHKTEMKAVLRCEDLKEAKKNFSDLKKRFKGKKIIVQETCRGIEMIVGVKEDVSFGKMLVVGFGGIFAEVKKDVSFRALSVSRSEIKKMVLELEGAKVLDARGKKYPLEKFYTLVEMVAHLAVAKDVKEMDLNPVILCEDCDCAKVVDARVREEADD
jgi:hypothetical protein